MHNPITSAVAQLTLPFVQWRQLGVSRDIAYNDYQQSVLDFQQTLYKALAAVDNALNRRLELQLQREQLNASLAQARLAARLNDIRYREGEIALQIWLEAQAQERQAERDLAQNRLETYLNLADLWRLTGGDEPLDNSHLRAGSRAVLTPRRWLAAVKGTLENNAPTGAVLRPASRLRARSAVRRKKGEVGGENGSHASLGGARKSSHHHGQGRIINQLALRVQAARSLWPAQDGGLFEVDTG